MNGKKVVSINIVVALCIIVVIFSSGLIAIVINYTSIIKEKDNIIAAKDSKISTLTDQITQLQEKLKLETQQLQQRMQELEQQSIRLQQQLMNARVFTNSLMMPKLIKVDLKADDNRSQLETPYLHVYGYVCNVGIYTALNSTIHVVTFQSGGVVAINTYINLGEVNGESWRNVDSNIYYSGNELVNWTLTLEWESPPLPV